MRNKARDKIEIDYLYSTNIDQFKSIIGWKMETFGFVTLEGKTELSMYKVL